MSIVPAATEPANPFLSRFSHKSPVSLLLKASVIKGISISKSLSFKASRKFCSYGSNIVASTMKPFANPPTTLPFLSLVNFPTPIKPVINWLIDWVMFPRVLLRFFPKPSKFKSVCKKPRRFLSSEPVLARAASCSARVPNVGIISSFPSPSLSGRYSLDAPTVFSSTFSKAAFPLSTNPATSPPN